MIIDRAGLVNLAIETLQWGRVIVLHINKREIHAERDRKFEEARRQRQICRKETAHKEEGPDMRAIRLASEWH